MQRVFIYLALLVAPLFASAASFEEVRKMASTTPQEFAASTIIEGIVVSDYRSLNNELNPNLDFMSVDHSQDLRTAYIVSEDGRYGFRIQFASHHENRLERYDRVKLELKGAVIVRENEPERYTISEVRKSSILSRVAGAPIAGKSRTIATLQDEDVYTLVTLHNTEFMTKSGSFSNVFEQFVQPMAHNSTCRPNGYTDGWASMFKDKNGDAMYMLINTRVAWRRGYERVPQGTGPITGVIVHTKMRRYADYMGYYQIRPMCREDIAVSKAPSSYYTTIVEWNWNHNFFGKIKFKEAGETDKWREERIIKDAVLADEGTGLLYTDSGAYLTLDAEYDSRFSDDANSKRANGALRLNTFTKQWYTMEGNDVKGVSSIYTEFSTEGLQGKAATFDFTFVAGNHSIDMSSGFPCDWKVEYSIDGVHFVTAASNISLRTMIWTNMMSRTMKGNRLLSYDCTTGFTEHSIPLPAAILGHKRVIVRLSPCSTRLATIPKNYADNSFTEEVKEDLNRGFALRIGGVSVKYIK